VPLADASVFCTALVIAQRTGGSVSTVLDSIAVSLREKRALDGKVRALTSQGKMQGVIIGSLPVALLFAVYLLDPQMVRPLFDTLVGRLMLAGGALLEIVGFLVIRKMTDIKY
jgi:tight adherence protein B